MKTSTNILKYGLIAFALLIISCDKQETQTNLPKETLLEEGLKSTTEHFDSEIEEFQEALIPSLHMSYDASLSEEEVNAKFRTEISKFEKEVGQTNRTSGYLSFVIITKTGKYAYNDTDGNVRGTVIFDSDNGLLNLAFIELNNPGNDRESDQWDAYYLGAHVQQVNWVEVLAGGLFLQGTDGWKIDHVTFSAYSFNQYKPSSGGTILRVTPRTWLDNTTSSGWDHAFWYSDITSRGRLTFK